MKAKEFEVKPRNFVAKNAKMGGAGQHKDKKKAEKQGDLKHKQRLVPMETIEEKLARKIQEHIEQGMAEGEEMSTFASLKDWRVWDVKVMNNFYSGKYPDYSVRLYSVVASSPEEAREVVINNADYVLQDLLSRKLQNGKKVLPRSSALPIEDKRVRGAAPGTITTVGFKKMLTPDGIKSFKFASGKIVSSEDKEVASEAVSANDSEEAKMKAHLQQLANTNDDGFYDALRDFKGMYGYDPKISPTTGHSRSGYTDRYAQQGSKKPSNGMYFYNVPADREEEAIAMQLKRSKSGKWFIPASNTLAIKAANSNFGAGKFWQLK